MHHLTSLSSDHILCSLTLGLITLVPLRPLKFSSFSASPGLVWETSRGGAGCCSNKWMDLDPVVCVCSFIYQPDQCFLGIYMYQE